MYARFILPGGGKGKYKRGRTSEFFNQPKEEIAKWEIKEEKPPSKLQRQALLKGQLKRHTMNVIAQAHVSKRILDELYALAPGIPYDNVRANLSLAGDFAKQAKEFMEQYEQTRSTKLNKMQEGG